MVVLTLVCLACVRSFQMCGPSTCSIEISVMGSHGRGLVVFTPLFLPHDAGISFTARFETIN